MKKVVKKINSNISKPAVQLNTFRKDLKMASKAAVFLIAIFVFILVILFIPGLIAFVVDIALNGSILGVIVIFLVLVVLAVVANRLKKR